VISSYTVPSFLNNIPVGGSRFVNFTVVRRKLKLKQITTESIKRALRHNNANKTIALLRLRGSTGLLLVVAPRLFLIPYSGSNVPK